MINKDHFSLKRIKIGLGVIPWIPVVASIIIAFLVFYYFDISDTLDNSLMLIDAVVHKQFFNFYDYAITNASSSTIYTANYNLPLYILFAVWNSPFYIIKMIWGLEGSLFQMAILWCKLLLVLASAGCVYVMISLLKEVGYEKNTRKYVSILFFSSSSLFMGAYIALQYDVLTLFFILLGIDAFLKKKGKKFLLIFMIAVPFKTFALFIFIPLLLIKEKKVLRILGSFVVSYSLIIIEKIMFWNDPAYELCLKSQNQDAIELITGGCLKIGNHGLIIFLMVFIAVCVYCYMQSENLYTSEDKVIKRQLLYYVAYLGFLIFTIFFVTVEFRSYWIILYLPFAILLIAMNANRLWLNIVLETIGSTAVVIYFLMKHWIYSIPEMCTALRLPRIIKIPEESCLRYGGIGNFLKNYLKDYGGVLITIFAACMLLLLIINRPKCVDLEKNDCYIGRSEYEGLLIRSMIPLIITIMVIYASVKGQNPVMLSATNEPAVMEKGIMDRNIYIQRFVVADERNLESMVLKFDNYETFRDCRGSIVFSIVSVKDGNVLYQKRVGTTLIDDDEDYRLNLNGIHVKEGQSYELIIEQYDKAYREPNDKANHKSNKKANNKSKNNDNDLGIDIYPYCTDVSNETMDQIMINGEYENKQLYMILR